MSGGLLPAANICGTRCCIRVAWKFLERIEILEKTEGSFESGCNTAFRAIIGQVFDFIGSGGGIRTPDTRIMIPLL
jgi:hypothetical protein